MSSPASQEIVGRFFQALEYLIDTGQIKSRLAFCRQYGIKHPYLYQNERDHSRKIFEMEWMAHLVNDYGISANWLLTGAGSMAPLGGQKLVLKPKE